MKQKKWFKVVLILALVLRLFLILKAYHGDLNNNISWGTRAAELGLKDFYEREQWEYSAPNQPPGTIYLFWLVGKIYRGVWDVSWWLNSRLPPFPSPFIWWWEQKGLWGLVKLPSILADLGIGWLIYSWVKKNRERLALPLATIWLFNPVSWYNSAFWGQTDGLVNFIGLIGVIGLIGGRIIKAIIFLSFSLFVKVSLFPFLPVFVVAMFWQKRMKELALGTLGALGILGIFSLPFHPRMDVFPWLIGVYQQRILPGEIGTLTANAFNFWAILVGKKLVLDNIAFWGISARIWGVFGFCFMLLMILMFLRGNLREKRIIFALTLVMFASFLFLTRMHERYLFPVFPLMTLLLAFYPRLFVFYLPLSLTHLLNLYSDWWQPYMGWLKELLLKEIVIRGISAFHLLLFFVLLTAFLFKEQWLKKKFLYFA